MTPTQIEQMARERYNAIGETFWSQAEMLNLMYGACMELAIETKCIEGSSTTASVASQAEYAYPTNVIAIKRVTYNGGRVDPIDFDQADQVTLNNTTATTTGQPVGYVLFDDVITLFPTPGESAIDIEIFGYKEPAELTISSTLEVPNWTHTRLVNYMLSEMYSKDKDFASAKHYKELWMKDVSEIKRWVAKRKRGNRFASVKDEDSMPGVFAG